MPKNMLCVSCGLPRELGRRQCDSCYKKDKTEKAMARYRGGFRYKWDKLCEHCGSPYKANRKTQRFCFSCYSKFWNTDSASEDGYVFLNFSNDSFYKHRVIAEKLLGRKLATNEFVHHIDLDRKNNEYSNLLVIDRRSHSRLHLFLRLQIFSVKSLTEDSSKIKIFLKETTLNWLQTTSTKHILLSEISKTKS